MNFKRKSSGIHIQSTENRLSNEPKIIAVGDVVEEEFFTQGIDEIEILTSVYLLLLTGCRSRKVIFGKPVRFKKYDLRPVSF